MTTKSRELLGGSLIFLLTGIFVAQGRDGINPERDPLPYLSLLIGGSLLFVLGLICMRAWMDYGE